MNKLFFILVLILSFFSVTTFAEEEFGNDVPMFVEDDPEVYEKILEMREKYQAVMESRSLALESQSDTSD